LTVFRRALNGFTFAISLMILSLVISSGCAPKETVKEKTDEEALRERVMAYWDYKIKGEFDKSYEYEDPLFRKKTGLVSYIRSFRPEVVKWKSVRIEKIAKEDDLATINLNVRTKVTLPQIKGVENNSEIKDKWVRVDGIWYHVSEEDGTN
jgi:hypothetical protein